MAYLRHYFIHLPLAAGFVLDAMISPPDAIAATATAERLKIPRRIVTILEGEALSTTRPRWSPIASHWRPWRLVHFP